MDESKIDWLAHKKGVGSGPGNLESNWPFKDGGPTPKKLPEPCWFIDVGDVSVYQGYSMKEARQALVLFPGGSIRYHRQTEHNLHEEVLERKERRRQGIEVRQR